VAVNPDRAMTLTPLPNLAELAEDPGKAAGLPRETLCRLLRTARRLAADLEYHLALVADAGAPQALHDGQDPDRRLSQEAAAEFLGVSVRWLRAHKVPGKIRLGRKVVYDARALARYLRRRTAKETYPS
jgi:hypothetical protein